MIEIQNCPSNITKKIEVPEMDVAVTWEPEPTAERVTKNGREPITRTQGTTAYNPGDRFTEDLTLVEYTYDTKNTSKTCAFYINVTRGSINRWCSLC